MRSLLSIAGISGQWAWEDENLDSNNLVVVSEEFHVHQQFAVSNEVLSAVLANISLSSTFLRHPNVVQRGLSHLLGFQTHQDCSNARDVLENLT